MVIFHFTPRMGFVPKREVFEETGISVKNIRYATFTNDIFKGEKKHYATLFVLAEYNGGDLRVKEPDKCEKWNWFVWGKFPENLFYSLKNLLTQGFDIQNGNKYEEAGSLEMHQFVFQKSANGTEPGKIFV